jgi:peptide/nickel transport system permease protein
VPLGYVGKRLAMAIPTLFGVAVVVFVLLRVVPGDPIAMMLPPGARVEDIERLRALYGLDRSIIEQFGRWLLDLVSGNFGSSISLHQGVLGLILSRLPATLELALAALVLATTAGVLFGVTAVYWRGRWPEVVVDAVTGLGMAIPDFLWGLLLVLGFGVLLPLLPIRAASIRNPRCASPPVSICWRASSAASSPSSARCWPTWCCRSPRWRCR